MKMGYGLDPKVGKGIQEAADDVRSRFGLFFRYRALTWYAGHLGEAIRRVPARGVPDG